MSNKQNDHYEEAKKEAEEEIACKETGEKFTMRGIVNGEEKTGKVEITKGREFIQKIPDPQPRIWRKNLMTLSEACDYLHCHPNTLRKWTDNGTVKCYRFGKRGDRRFDKRDLEKQLDEAMDGFECWQVDNHLKTCMAHNLTIKQEAVNEFKNYLEKRMMDWIFSNGKLTAKEGRELINYILE